MPLLFGLPRPINQAQNSGDIGSDEETPRAAPAKASSSTRPILLAEPLACKSFSTPMNGRYFND